MGKNYAKHPIFKQIPEKTTAETLEILKGVVNGTHEANELVEALLSVSGMFVSFLATSYRISDKDFIDEWVSTLCVRLTQIANNRDILVRTAKHPNPSISNTVSMTVRSTLIDCFRSQRRNRRIALMDLSYVGKDDNSTDEIDLNDLMNHLLKKDPNNELLKMRLDNVSFPSARKQMALTTGELSERVNSLLAQFI